MAGYNRLNTSDLQNIDWNMNIGYLMQLDRRRDDKAKAAIVGDLYGWYRSNVEIIVSIWPIVKKKEDKKTSEALKASVKEIGKKLKNRPMQNQPWHHQQVLERNNYSDVEEKLQELDFQIIELIFKHKLIKVQREKKTTEEILEYDHTRE